MDKHAGNIIDNVMLDTYMSLERDTKKYYSGNAWCTTMTKVEKKALNSMHNKIDYIALAAVLIASCLIRTILLPIISGDASTFLLPWYDTIKQKGISEQVGDYNIFYQLLILLMTKIPGSISPLSEYKCLSFLFDYLLAGAIAILAADCLPESKTGFFPFLLVIMSPLVILNSAAWAQCDSIYSFWC